MKNFIWDFDGTIGNVYHSYTKSLLIFLEKYHINAEYEYAYQLLRKKSVPYALEFYFGKKDKEISSQYRMLRNEAASKEAAPVDEVCEIIKGIYTRKGNNFLYTHNGKFAKNCLENWGILECFTDFILNDAGFPRKPSPDALNYLIDKHQLVKNETIMIGDRDVDIQSAHNAGIQALLFDEDDFFVDCDAEYIIKNMKEIYQISDFLPF